MENFIQQSSIDAVTCPACGLLCDDISISADSAGKLKVTSNSCAKSISFFERPVKAVSPRVGGKDTDLESAIAKASEILSKSKHPLIGGLGTDVQGMRAVMNLAEKSGATIDHMNSKSSMRNLLVLQNSGWQVTTLTEVRNRVDLLLVVGTDIVSYFPRFFDRVIWNQASMFGQDTSTREVVYLGGQNLNTKPGTSPKGIEPTVLPCDKAQLPEVIAVLRALIAGKTLVASSVGGIAVTDLAKLAERLKAAKYSVVAWTGSALDYPQAELTIQNVTGLVEKLNQTTRSSGLPLGGNEGDVGAYNTSTWISGYPFRSSYRQGFPDYEPYLYSTDRMLAEQEADTFFWINSYAPDRLAPAHQAASVVIGHADMKLDHEPEVFIPVATPGIDSKGTQFRSDSSVSLPLKQLRSNTLPTLTQVLSAIEATL